MTSVSYVLADPNGNRTVLADRPVNDFNAEELGTALLAQEPSAEQAGFFSLTKDGAELYMAGGEFCGNASMAAAALAAERIGLQEGGFAALRILCSGSAAPVTVSVLRQNERSFSVTAALPRPDFIEERDFSLDGEAYRLPFAAFPGTGHILLSGEPFASWPREKAERALKAWAAETGLPCQGLLFFDENAGTLTPLVAVKGISLFWESSCASGSTAIGDWLIRRKKRIFPLTLRQPGGTLELLAADDRFIYIRGKVIFEKDAVLGD